VQTKLQMAHITHLNPCAASTTKTGPLRTNHIPNSMNVTHLNHLAERAVGWATLWQVQAEGAGLVADDMAPTSLNEGRGEVLVLSLQPCWLYLYMKYGVLPNRLIYPHGTLPTTQILVTAAENG